MAEADDAGVRAGGPRGAEHAEGALSAARWLACVAALAACESEGTAPHGLPSGLGNTTNSVTVIVGNNSFSPRVAHLNSPGTVTWKWMPGGVAHNVTFAGGPKSPTQSFGTFSHEFEAGAYDYSCTLHPETGGQLVVH